jgi:hypothetical protein
MIWPFGLAARWGQATTAMATYVRGQKNQKKRHLDFFVCRKIGSFTPQKMSRSAFSVRTFDGGCRSKRSSVGLFVEGYAVAPFGHSSYLYLLGTTQTLFESKTQVGPPEFRLLRIT